MCSPAKPLILVVFFLSKYGCEVTLKSGVHHLWVALGVQGPALLGGQKSYYHLVTEQRGGGRLLRRKGVGLRFGSGGKSELGGVALRFIKGALRVVYKDWLLSWEDGQSRRLGEIPNSRACMDPPATNSTQTRMKKHGAWLLPCITE